MTAPSILAVTVIELDVVNTLAETDFLSYTVPANTLGTTHGLRVRITADYLNNSAATRTLTIKIKYGSTTLWEDTTKALGTTASRYPLFIEFVLFPKNATNSQGVAGLIMLGTAAGATTGIGDVATDEISALAPIVGANASEDSTTALDLKVTVTHSTNNSNLSVRKLYSIIEGL